VSRTFGDVNSAVKGDPLKDISLLKNVAWS